MSFVVYPNLSGEIINGGFPVFRTRNRKGRNNTSRNWSADVHRGRKFSERYNISSEGRDQFASLSHQRAVRSIQENQFKDEIVLFPVLQKQGEPKIISLKTTNCIECLMAVIGQSTNKVDNWKNSDQKHRWFAAALSDIEPRLGKEMGSRYLGELRMAMQKEIEKLIVKDNPMKDAAE